MGGNTNFGSRSEFLPGEGCEETDIKYQRYGGCFVTYRKALLYVIGSVLFAALVGFLVHHYFPRHKISDNDFEAADDFISELLKSVTNSETEKSSETSKLSSNIVPSYYRLRIQPYLDESDTLFSFEGRVIIKFHIEKSPTKTIILNAKNLNIAMSSVSLTYSSTSKVEPLQSGAQVLEGAEGETSSTTAAEDATSMEPLQTTIAPNLNEDTNNTIVDTANDNNKTDTNTTLSLTNDSSSDAGETPASDSQPEIIHISDKTNIVISSQELEEQDETYILHLDSHLELGIDYNLEIHFKGNLSDGLGGIIRSSYKQGNTTTWMVSTLYKPSYARTAFPCFDDPKYKTQFEISIARKSSMTAVSNMPIKDTEPFGNSSEWLWDHFEISNPMPTYLVAFSVHNFDSKKGPSSFPLPVMKAWSRNEVLEKTAYMLDIARKVTESYNKFFGFSYSLPKIDFVAVPNFPIDAIGNWGLIFIRESNVLGEDSSYEEKENIADLVSRELARQWFGNLVTVRSWNESWIIDAMCNYAHYIGMDKAEPSWNILQKLVINDVQDVLDSDSTNLLPKLASYSANSDHFSNEQQKLLNKKGSSLLHMLNETIQEASFIKGLQTFIEKWKFKTFIQDNFLQELNFENNSLPSGIEVNDIMNLWTTQKGYPLVTVSTSTNGSVTFKQYRFTENQTPSNNLWILPLDYMSNKATNSSRTWLVDTSPKTIENVVGNQNDSWVFFNLNQACLCRVNYDLNNWNSLIRLLKTQPETLSATSRAQLLDDAFHLARSGILNYNVTLNLALYLRENERHVIPWTTALKNMEFLRLILSKTRSYGDFQDYAWNLIEPIYNSVIENSEQKSSYEEHELRRQIVTFACKLKYEPCRSWADSKYQNLVKFSDSDKQDNELRSIAYCVGVEMRGRTAWDILWNRYENVKYNQSEDINALLTGLGCIKETWLIIKYLHRAVEEESIPYSVLMWDSLSSDHAIDVAFRFLRENWDSIFNKYKNSQLAFRQMLNIIFSKLTTKNDLDELVKFLSTRKSDIKFFAHDIAIVIEKLKLKLSWKKIYIDVFSKWMKNDLSI